ncbi:Probable adenine permease PurP [Kingella potus]|uniref:Probable adenine permease PurP n=1 Tax=Kingella potus TaxID=265175 RepID=A0A377R346_9NEIS|nr:NCS2 family permease [Kingella potus]UOP00220.1 NCS2 family permease [Kingella potus]STR02723.1 Probable adenine permease PurP [Kingella potus]
MNTPANKLLERLFGLSAHSTNVRTEIMAGITTFLTMCYIVVINPATLSQAGMDFGAVFVATCISAAIGCFVMGLAANYPIALAPGMGLNAYFTYAVVKGMGVPWEVALAAVFVSGIIFLLFSFFKLREMLVNALPMSLKMAIAAGIGLFLALIALKNAGIIISSDATLVKMNDIYIKAADGAKSPNWPLLLALLGFFLIILLDYLRVRGAIILGILAVTLLGIPLGQTEFKGVVSAIPSLQPTLLAMDFNGLFHGSMIAVVFVFFLVDLFDSTGTLVGTTHRAGLLENGKLPRLKRALLADSSAIIAGAAMGTSSVTPYVESAAGVAAGGRTGLTAVTVGVLMLACLWFSPLAATVPAFATAPALLYIGIHMLRSVLEIDWEDLTEAAPAFITIVFMPFTYSIADGIAMGFISYAAIKLLCGRTKDVPPMVWLVAVLWAAKFWFLGV